MSSHASDLTHSHFGHPCVQEPDPPSACPLLPLLRVQELTGMQLHPHAARPASSTAQLVPSHLALWWQWECAKGWRAPQNVFSADLLPGASA